MKMVLFTGHGGIYLNSELKKIFKDFSIQNRIDAVDYLQTHYEDADKDYYAYLEQIKKKDVIVKADEKTYLCWNVDNESICVYSIVDVDTTRPWTIEHYDGSEYVKYLEFKLIDEKYNYYKCKEWTDDY